MSSGDIPVFRPNWNEFKDFSKYIHQIEQLDGNKDGLAKIVPPKEWKPRASGYSMVEIGEISIPSPRTQVVRAYRDGIYYVNNTYDKNPMTVKDFMEFAQRPKNATPSDTRNLERQFWENITGNSPKYGSDSLGTLIDSTEKHWNLNKLGSILDYTIQDYGVKYDGVHTSYLYFGMWKSFFAWHTEDMDLHSISYLHFGEPKSWYGIPPEHGARFEELAKKNFPSEYKRCPAFLRHKGTMISPELIRNNSIPVKYVIQKPGEIIITFPYAYHAGFNHGFNCAEAVNFATIRWIDFGKRATLCTCHDPSHIVRINMHSFVRRYQPDRYYKWLEGKDLGIHPQKPLYTISIANRPTKRDVTEDLNYKNGLPNSVKSCLRY